MQDEENLVTEGGYSYIVNEEGIKIRNSLVGRRIKEDKETFKEYKIRQKFVKTFIKEKKEGKYTWLSKKEPSQELQIKVALQIDGVLGSDEFKEHKGNNLGTYNKKEVKNFLDKHKNG